MADHAPNVIEVSTSTISLEYDAQRDLTLPFSLIDLVPDVISMSPDSTILEYDRRRAHYVLAALSSLEARNKSQGAPSHASLASESEERSQSHGSVGFQGDGGNPEIKQEAFGDEADAVIEGSSYDVSGKSYSHK